MTHEKLTDEWFFENAGHNPGSKRYPYYIWVGSKCLRSNDTHDLKAKFDALRDSRDES